MSRSRPSVVALAAVGAPLAAAACTTLPGEPWSRLPFGIALALVLPGLALSRALFPGRRGDPVRSVALTIGLSAAVSVISAVEMGALGALSPELWAAVLAAVTLLAAWVAHLRAERPGSRIAVSPSPRRRRFPAVAGALAALLVVGAAIAIARTPLEVPDDRGYTVVSMVPVEGGSTVLVRIQSEEARARSFQLVIDVPGRTRDSEELRLAPGQRLERRIPAPPAGRAGAIRVSLVDPLTDPPSVYRRVRLALPLQKPAPVLAEDL